MATFEGKARVFTITPVIVPAAYASNDQIGVLLEIPEAVDADGDTATVLSLVVIDKASQSSKLDILLFSDEPTVASADNAAVNISDAEMAAKYLGRVGVEAADYVATAGSTDATKSGIGLLVQAAKGKRSIYALVQSKGTPTYASASDLVIKLGFVQD